MHKFYLNGNNYYKMLIHIILEVINFICLFAFCDIVFKKNCVKFFVLIVITELYNIRNGECKIGRILFKILSFLSVKHQSTVRYKKGSRNADFFNLSARST